MTRLLVILLLVSSAAYADSDDDFKEFKPAPGRDAVAPMKPTWCAGYKPDNEGCDERCQQRKLWSLVQHWQGETGESDLQRIARLACDFPDNPKIQKQVASLRQSWINRTGLSERDDREALRLYIAGDDPDKAADKACDRLQPEKPEGAVEWRRWSLVNQALCSGDPATHGTHGADTHFDDMLWLERPDKPVSQLGIAYYVLHGIPALDASNAKVIAGNYPMALFLAARFDRRAFDAELNALGLGGIAKHRATVIAAMATAANRVLVEAGKGDANLAKQLAAAEVAFQAWQKQYQANKTTFDLVYAVEDKVMAIPIIERLQPHPIGCEDLRKALREHITAQKPKTKDSVEAAATDAVGYVELSRLELCDAAEGRWADAAAEQLILETGRFSSGPYTAALFAMIDAGAHPENAQLSDDVAHYTKRIIDEHVRHVSTLNERYEGTGGISMEEYRRQGHLVEMGRVDTVKKVGDGIEISFKTEKWSEPDFKCTNTGRIIQWNASGEPQYNWHCEISGSHTEEFTLKPRAFTDRSAADVKPGMIIKVVTSEVSGAKGPPPSFVIEIDAPAKGKTPPTTTSFFGIKLK